MRRCLAPAIAYAALAALAFLAGPAIPADGSIVALAVIAAYVAVSPWWIAWRRSTLLNASDDRARAGTLRVEGDVLKDRRGDEALFQVDRGDVARVEICKVDRITTDDVCCDLLLADGTRLTIDEDLPGWPEALAWLEALPGFFKDWQAEVMQPPFAERRLVAFERPA